MSGLARVRLLMTVLSMSLSFSVAIPRPAAAACCAQPKVSTVNDTANAVSAGFVTTHVKVTENKIDGGKSFIPASPFSVWVDGVKVGESSSPTPLPTSEPDQVVEYAIEWDARPFVTGTHNLTWQVYNYGGVLLTRSYTINLSSSCEAASPPITIDDMVGLAPDDVSLQGYVFSSPVTQSIFLSKLPAGTVVYVVLGRTSVGSGKQYAAGAGISPNQTLIAGLSTWNSGVLASVQSAQSDLNLAIAGETDAATIADLQAEVANLSLLQAAYQSAGGVPIKAFAVARTGNGSDEAMQNAFGANLVGTTSAVMDTNPCWDGTSFASPTVSASANEASRLTPTLGKALTGVAARGGNNLSKVLKTIASSTTVEAVYPSSSTDGPVQTNVRKHTYSPGRVLVSGYTTSGPTTWPWTGTQRRVGLWWKWNSLSNIAYWQDPQRQTSYRRGFEMQMKMDVLAGSDGNTNGAGSFWGKPSWTTSSPPTSATAFPPNPIYFTNLPCPYADDYMGDSFNSTSSYLLTIGSACKPGTSAAALATTYYWIHSLLPTTDVYDDVYVVVTPVHRAVDFANQVYCVSKGKRLGSCMFSDNGVASPKIAYWSDRLTPRTVRLPTSGIWLFRHQ